MTSKVRKLFNFISIILLLWTIISGIYLALPQEYKDLIPQFNWLTALVSGGSTGVLGSTILFVDNQLKKQNNSNDNRNLEMAKIILGLNQKYEALENKIDSNTKVQVKGNELLEKNNRLISIDLESKLSNPLVEEFVKEKMRGEGIGKEEEINL